MSETESTNENEANEKVEEFERVTHEDLKAKIENLQKKGFASINKYFFRTIDSTKTKTQEELLEIWLNAFKNLTTIEFSVVEEPLTPQNLALILSALTELTTKLWLIEKRRFADLIEYTQTHDTRFANEAGSTIAWATYNSPFSFGFQVDKLVPSVAEAVITVVDGLSQRKAKAEKLEIDNQAAAQKIKEAEEALKQQQEMANLEREKREIELEKLRLENQKERQALTEQRLESQMKQIGNALELAGKAVDIVHPNIDPEMRPVLIQTLVNNILQLDNVVGLQLALPDQSIVEMPTKEEATTSAIEDNPETKENEGQ